MMHTVTLMVEHEPLTVELDEEVYTEYSRHEAEQSLLLAEWRRKVAALNASEPVPPVRERGAEGLVGYGCVAVLVFAAVLFGFVLGIVLRH